MAKGSNIYEEARKQRVQENQKLFEDLGIGKMSKGLSEVTNLEKKSPKNQAKTRSRMTLTSPGTLRRSSRPHNLVPKYEKEGLPNEFCTVHLPLEGKVNMVLEDEHEAKYDVVYIGPRSGLSGGWKAFALDHKLDDGDAVVFELTEPTKFKVYIFRAFNGIGEVDAEQNRCARERKSRSSNKVKDFNSNDEMSGEDAVESTRAKESKSFNSKKAKKLDTKTMRSTKPGKATDGSASQRRRQSCSSKKIAKEQAKEVSEFEQVNEVSISQELRPGGNPKKVTKEGGIEAVQVAKAVCESVSTKPQAKVKYFRKRTKYC